MKKWSRWFLIIFFAVITFIIFLLFYLPSFLSYARPVESKILLIESWISANEIEQAVKYSKLNGRDYSFCLTGFVYPDKLYQQKSKGEDGSKVKITKKGLPLLTNCSLKIRIPQNLDFTEGDTLNIELITSGDKVAGYGPHFNVLVDGSYIGGAFAESQPSSFFFRYIVESEKPHSIYIRFNNDLWTKTQDRNLFVAELSINNQEIELINNNRTVEKRLTIENTGFKSQALEMANYLQDLGIDPEYISTISFDAVETNQTLASAKSFRDQVDLTQFSSINIVSSGLHSRRTWYTYNNILPMQIDVGILYFQSPSRQNLGAENRFEDYINLMDEGLAYLINWILLKI